MSAFTLIWEYQGGTYIKQVRARTPSMALITWSRSLNPGEVRGLGERRLARLVREMEKEATDLYRPVAMTGLTNAWCAGAPLGGLLNIVKTDLSP